MLEKHIELADYEQVYGALPGTLLAKTISAEEAMAEQSDYQSSSDPSDASDEPALPANKKKLAAAEALRKEQQK